MLQPRQGEARQWGLREEVGIGTGNGYGYQMLRKGAGKFVASWVQFYAIG